MNNDTHGSHPGYYLVTIRPSTPKLLLSRNDERAFIISCMQDLLGSRSLLCDAPLPSKLAVHIDLLAFSVQKEAIQLVTFSITRTSLEVLANALTSSLARYQSDSTISHAPAFHNAQPIVSIRQLIGPHDALKMSIEIHLNHLDWEFDRYSSIGFYLHDRRGDWVRLWRLSPLYENNPVNYLKLLELSLNNYALVSISEENTTSPLYATLKRA